jgi:hypothetical protein
VSSDLPSAQLTDKNPAPALPAVLGDPIPPPALPENGESLGRTGALTTAFTLALDQTVTSLPLLGSALNALTRLAWLCSHLTWCACGPAAAGVVPQAMVDELHGRFYAALASLYHRHAHAHPAFKCVRSRKCPKPRSSTMPALTASHLYPMTPGALQARLAAASPVASLMYAGTRGSHSCMAMAMLRRALPWRRGSNAPWHGKGFTKP